MEFARIYILCMYYINLLAWLQSRYRSPTYFLKEPVIDPDAKLKSALTNSTVIVTVTSSLSVISRCRYQVSLSVIHCVIHVYPDEAILQRKSQGIYRVLDHSLVIHYVGSFEVPG